MTKKFYLFLFALLLFTPSLRAQFISFTYTTDSVVYGAPNPLVELIVHADVQNLTANDVHVMCDRLVNDTAVDWHTYFCLVDCMPYWTSSSVATLPAGGSTEFTFHFMVSNVPDSSMAQMRFRVQENPTEMYYHWYKGITDSAFVSVVDATQLLEVKAYPVPAASGQPLAIRISGPAAWSNSGTVRLTDLNGKLISTTAWSGESILEINTASLAAGLYLYEVSAEGINPVTGKISLTQ